LIKGLFYDSCGEVTKRAKKKPDVLSPSHQTFSTMVADFLSPTTKLIKLSRYWDPDNCGVC